MVQFSYLYLLLKEYIYIYIYVIQNIYIYIYTFYTSTSNIFSHNIYVEGLIFSRPWVCRGWLLEPSFSDPPAGPGTWLLFYTAPKQIAKWETRFLKAHFHYTTILWLWYGYGR